MNEHAFQVDRIEAEENLVIDAQFLLQGLLNDRGISRAELARRAGISRARLTQLMKPEANPTLRTLAAVFAAIGERIEIGAQSKQPTAGSHSGGGWSVLEEREHVGASDFGFRIADWADRPLRVGPLVPACNDNPSTAEPIFEVA